jgi:hypothetical protein
MFAIHVLRFSLLMIASDSNGQMDLLLDSLRRSEGQISQHIDFLSMMTGHLAMSEECLQEKYILPVFEKILKEFPNQKVQRRLAQICTEKEMPILVQALNRVEETSATVSALPVAQPTNSGPRPRALKTMVQLPSNQQSGTNIQCIGTPQGLTGKPKPTIQDLTQNKENTDNQQSVKVATDRRSVFFENYIKPYKQEKPLQKISHNEKNNRQLKVVSSNDRDKNSSKDSKKLTPRYNRIIKQAHKPKPMLRPITNSMHVVTAQTLSLTNLHKMKMSFADFPDFSETDNGVFSHMATQQTFEDCPTDLQSGNSNCFNQVEETHSIDFDAFNDGVIAMRTPIKLPDPVDPGMPALNLDD